MLINGSALLLLLSQRLVAGIWVYNYLNASTIIRMVGRPTKGGRADDGGEHGRWGTGSGKGRRRQWRRPTHQVRYAIRSRAAETIAPRRCDWAPKKIVSQSDGKSLSSSVFQLLPPPASSKNNKTRRKANSNTATKKPITKRPKNTLACWARDMCASVC